LKQCKDGMMCHGKLNRCLPDPYNIFEGKLPGEACEYNYQCLSNKCSQLSYLQSPIDYDETPISVCEGLKEKSECKSDSECGTGLFCDSLSTKCQPLKELDQSCTRDEECSNTMACSNKLCKLYGSLLDYEVSDNSLVCQSGFIKEIESNGITKSVCVPSPKLVNKLGPDYKCSSPEDTCKYEVSGEYSFSFETTCACGLTPTGASFCPHIYTSSYTTLLRRVTEKFGQHCHTKDRTNIYECLTSKVARQQLTDEADLKLLNDFIVEHFER
jgi:Dickkopf N-terminal cysteine-rich region